MIRVTLAGIWHGWYESLHSGMENVQSLEEGDALVRCYRQEFIDSSLVGKVTFQ